MRFQFIEEYKKAYPIELMCEVLQVSRSGYYEFLKLKKVNSSSQYFILISKVQEIFEASGGSYGSRRISAALKAQGDSVGRFQARALMKQAGVAIQRRIHYSAQGNKEI